MRKYTRVFLVSVFLTSFFCIVRHPVSAATTYKRVTSPTQKISILVPSTWKAKDHADMGFIAYNPTYGEPTQSLRKDESVSVAAFVYTSTVWTSVQKDRVAFLKGYFKSTGVQYDRMVATTMNKQRAVQVWQTDKEESRKSLTTYIFLPNGFFMVDYEASQKLFSKTTAMQQVIMKSFSAPATVTAYLKGKTVAFDGGHLRVTFPTFWRSSGSNAGVFLYTRDYANLFTIPVVAVGVVSHVHTDADAPLWNALVAKDVTAVAAAVKQQMIDEAADSGQSFTILKKAAVTYKGKYGVSLRIAENATSEDFIGPWHTDIVVYVHGQRIVKLMYTGIAKGIFPGFMIEKDVIFRSVEFK